MRSILRRYGLIYIFYVLLACLALYPLLFHATTDVGGSWTTDYYHFHWDYWWIRHALTTPGLNVYETNFIFYPYTTNLAFETLTPIWFPLWALLEPILGTLVAMDIIMVVAMALGGFCFYLLLRHERVHAGLALAFGALLEISAGMMLAAMLETINYLTLFWLPLTLLLWERIAKTHGRAAVFWTISMGLAFYGTMMTDFQFMLFLVFLLVPFGVLTLVEQANWRQRLIVMGRGVVALAIMTVLLWFVGPLPYILKYDFSALSPMPIQNAGGIPFPLGYFWRFDTYNRAVTLGSLVIPLLILALLLSIVVRKQLKDRRRWFWLALAIIPLVLSIGPFIKVGDSTIWMPYIALHDLFGGLFRSPARFDAVIIITVLLFVGKTLTPLIARLRRNTIRYGVAVAGLLLVVLDARIFIPMPIQPVTQSYDFYQTIGNEKGAPYDNEVIVEVPVAGGSGEAWVGDFKPMEAEFYGMTHGKRMLNGSIARAPLGNFWYWLYDDPMLAWLGQRRFIEPDKVEAQLKQRIFSWPIGYIVVHQDWIGRDSPTDQEVLGYLNSLRDLLCPVAIEKDAVFYRTVWHPDGCPPRTPPQTSLGTYTIDIGSPDDVAYIGWGWHYAESVAGLTLRWTGEYPQTQTYLDLPPGDYKVTLSAQAFYESRQLKLLVNDQPLDGTQMVTVDALHDYTYTIPASLIGTSASNPVKLTLDYDATVQPSVVQGSGDTRKLAIAVDTITFTQQGH